jgi:hypothetical protein
LGWPILSNRSSRRASPTRRQNASGSVAASAGLITAPDGYAQLSEEAFLRGVQK